MQTTESSTNPEKVRLIRTVRFCVNPPGAPASGQGKNTFAASPTLVGLGCFYELDITCSGVPSHETGYLLNIREIDEAVRQHSLKIITGFCHEKPLTRPAEVLLRVLPDLQTHLDAALERITWHLTPYCAVSLEKDCMEHVTLTEKFSFAASHRLHSPLLDEQKNAAVYGKCNNPAGHGHNYHLEVAVDVPVDSPFSFSELESAVSAAVTEKLDHKNLNTDVPELKDTIPSTENLTRFIYNRLSKVFPAPEVKLKYVRLWETEKTSCIYPP